MTKLKLETPNGKPKKKSNVGGCIVSLVSLGVIGYIIYILCNL